MNVILQGFLIGAAVAVILVFFEYTAILREVAERSKRVAKKVEWDSNQKTRMRNIVTFGLALPIGFAIGAWWIFA